MMRTFIRITLLISRLGVTLSAQDFTLLRERMVFEQLEAQGIRSPSVLTAMRKVERHRFVPSESISNAYGDFPVPIGEGQTISQPFVVAFMTQAINLRRTDKVLEVGTGSGYQAAILAELCKEIYTIEIIELLGMRASELLKSLGYKNIHLKIADGYQGWLEAAPFDAIIVTCSPSHVPKPLQDQLKEGGRMVIPVGEAGAQVLVLLTKKKGKLIQENQIPVRFVPMKDKKGKRY